MFHYNMKKIIKIIFLVTLPLILGLGIFLYYKNLRIVSLDKIDKKDVYEVEKESGTNVEKSSVSNIYKCDFWKNKKFGWFTSENGGERGYAGTLIVSGELVTKIKEFNIGEPGELNDSSKGVNVVKYLYLVPTVPKTEEEKLFNEVHDELARSGNIVNEISNNKLFFVLGIVENNNIITSANISDETKEALLGYADTGKYIEIKITIPIYQGGGASSDFSYACEIGM